VRPEPSLLGSGAVVEGQPDASRSTSVSRTVSGLSGALVSVGGARDRGLNPLRGLQFHNTGLEAVEQVVRPWASDFPFDPGSLRRTVLGGIIQQLGRGLEQRVGVAVVCLSVFALSCHDGRILNGRVASLSAYMAGMSGITSNGHLSN
jgi:hypothetical protein